MRTAKTLVAVIGAVLALGIWASGASARNYSFSSQFIRIVFREAEFFGAFGNITCVLTVEGSFHARTLAKASNSLVGNLTNATLGQCAEGRATVLRETLPWHVQYTSFFGTLPNINAISLTVLGFSARIQEPLASCLMRSSELNPVPLSLGRRSEDRVLWEAHAITLLPTSCGILAGIDFHSTSVTTSGGSARVTLTLI